MLISCVAYVNIVYLDLTSKTNFLRKSLRSVTIIRLPTYLFEIVGFRFLLSTILPLGGTILQLYHLLYFSAKEGNSGYLFFVESITFPVKAPLAPSIPKIIF